MFAWLLSNSSILLSFAPSFPLPGGSLSIMDVKNPVKKADPIVRPATNIEQRSTIVSGGVHRQSQTNFCIRTLCDLLRICDRSAVDLWCLSYDRKFSRWCTWSLIFADYEVMQHHKEGFKVYCISDAVTKEETVAYCHVCCCCCCCCLCFISNLETIYWEPITSYTWHCVQQKTVKHYLIDLWIPLMDILLL